MNPTPEMDPSAGDVGRRLRLPWGEGIEARAGFCRLGYPIGEIVTLTDYQATGGPIETPIGGPVAIAVIPAGRRR
jgi:hypothetical protein